MNNQTIIENSLITNIRISDGAYRLYILLQSMCYGDKTTCYPSQRYMAVSLGRSVRTIQRYLKELVRNGLVLIKRRGSISSIISILAKKTRQAGEKLAKAIKSNVRNSNVQNKNTKHGNWDIEHRNYNFNKLEKALRGQIECQYDELIE